MRALFTFLQVSSPSHPITVIDDVSKHCSIVHKTRRSFSACFSSVLSVCLKLLVAVLCSSLQNHSRVQKKERPKNATVTLAGGITALDKDFVVLIEQKNPYGM